MSAPDQLRFYSCGAPRRDHGGTDRRGPLARRDREDGGAGARQRRAIRAGFLRRSNDGIVAGNPSAPERHVQHVVERGTEQRAIARR